MTTFITKMPFVFKHHQLERVQREQKNLKVSRLKKGQPPPPTPTPKKTYAHLSPPCAFISCHFTLGQLGVDCDYSENLKHLILWQSQQGFFKQISSTLFILIVYYIHPRTGRLEVHTYAFLTSDLDHTSVHLVFFYIDFFYIPFVLLTTQHYLSCFNVLHFRNMFSTTLTKFSLL